MNFLDYLQLEAVHITALKNMRVSPLHYKHGLEEPIPDVPTLIRGRVTHIALLEPTRLETDVAVFDGPRRQGKAWDAFEAANVGKAILKVDEYETCLAAAKAVLDDEIAAPYFVSGEPEVTLTWTDRATGLACKGRLDWRSHSKKAIVDLKTSADIIARRFGATAARLGYHNQGAWYQDGDSLVTGVQRDVVLVAVESDPPHAVAVYRIDDDALYVGRQENAQLLARVAECRRANRWPGPYEAEQVLELPRYVWGDDMDLDGIGFQMKEAG